MFHKMILRYAGVRKIRGRYFSEFYDVAQTIAFMLRKNILCLLKRSRRENKKCGRFSKRFLNRPHFLLKIKPN
ncbi:hypothetical protein DPV83_02515 [Aggregatibacter segnis]|uniref:Uncharacterized protein n=1 Tax=Aggregatibacter segnis TaxID=739 RepID=A0A8B2U446_9PAST|nr:hypothetical protein DPV83_02515 [Aggregatibacter segnis]